MSSGPARRVSPKDIQVVQNLIERCLQLYMNRREVVETLLAQAKIEPGFTELVWQKLEEENREFFKAYYLRLVVKHQILQFNKLLEQQVQLMHQMNLNPSIPHLPTSNGSHIPPLHQNPARYAPEHVLSAMKPESMHHTVGSSLQNAVTNGGSSLNSNIHTAVDMTIHANRLDVPPSMISTQSSNMGLMQGINGGMIKSEAGYLGTSQYILGADGGVLEARPIVDAPVASFGSVESNSQALNDLLLDADTPFGLLSNIPRNFSLSDIAAHFPHSSDLEAYSKSPFLTENETFLDLHEKDSEEDTKKLDTISEGMSYDDFGSE